MKSLEGGHVDEKGDHPNARKFQEPDLGDLVQAHFEMLRSRISPQISDRNARTIMPVARNAVGTRGTRPV